jgi:hemerythrin
MPFMKWDDRYTTGVDIVDEQHRKLIEFTSQIYSFGATTLQARECLNTVKNVVTYAADHFATEERMMSVMKDEGIESHRTEHTEFMNKAITVAAEFEKTGIIDIRGLATFLARWIHSHILKTDKVTFARMTKAGLTNDMANRCSVDMDGFEGL